MAETKKLHFLKKCWIIINHFCFFFFLIELNKQNPSESVKRVWRKGCDSSFHARSNNIMARIFPRANLTTNGGCSRLIVSARSICLFYRIMCLSPLIAGSAGYTIVVVANNRGTWRTHSSDTCSVDLHSIECCRHGLTVRPGLWDWL